MRKTIKMSRVNDLIIQMHVPSLWKKTNEVACTQGQNSSCLKESFMGVSDVWSFFTTTWVIVFQLFGIFCLISKAFKTLLIVTSAYRISQISTFKILEETAFGEFRWLPLGILIYLQTRNWDILIFHFIYWSYALTLS